ncbi:MAG: T9SS C-terminal target domain-containing protein, partial [Calditrichaeota bacterium]
IAGIPLVAIGHTEHHAWTFTSGMSDNSDVYIDSTFDASYTSYYHNGQWLPFEVLVDTIHVAGGNPVVFTHYRTIHGPVFGDDLPNHQVYALKMTFWNEELHMARFLYNAIKATDLAGFEAALQLNPMSFNTFYIDRNQNVKFWHAGKYQDRTDGVDPRLPHRGDGSEEWGGFIPFTDLPMAANPAQGYFVNWNNKPVSWWNNGDNVPWYDNTWLTIRVILIDDYVSPIGSFTYENLKNVPFAIQSHGTYQQAIEISPTDIIDENIVPPGQSGFIDINGVPSPHFSDQWPLHVNWQFKDQLFGVFPTALPPDDRTLPARPELYPNYPNPFNPATYFEFRIADFGFVELKIYNIMGQAVKTLVREKLAPGRYAVQWDGTDDAGRQVASGIYLYRLKTGNFTATRKMVLLR